MSQIMLPMVGRAGQGKTEAEQGGMASCSTLSDAMIDILDSEKY